MQGKGRPQTDSDRSDDEDDLTSGTEGGADAPGPTQIPGPKRQTSTRTKPKNVTRDEQPEAVVDLTVPSLRTTLSGSKRQASSSREGTNSKAIDDAMDVDPPEYVHMNSFLNMKYSNIRLTELNNP